MFSGTVCLNLGDGSVGSQAVHKSIRTRRIAAGRLYTIHLVLHNKPQPKYGTLILSMKKSTQARKQLPKSNHNMRTYKSLGIVIAIFAVPFFVFGAIHIVQINAQFSKDKKNFAQVEKNMAAALSSISQAAGQPYEIKTEKGCGYGALKFARGPLGCTIAYTFAFSVSNPEESRQNGELVYRAIAGKFGFSEGFISYGLSSLSEESGQFEFHTSSNGLGCDLRHDPYTAADYNIFGRQTIRLQRNTATYMSSYSFECTRTVPRALYTIEKSTE